ncbi:MAG: hypothetical protein AB7F43_10300 [Bacteriovoracia bacterium]
MTKRILNFFLFSITFLCGFTCSALALETRSVHCHNGAIKRRVELFYLKEGSKLPCRVEYFKDVDGTETSQTIWEAQNTVGSCESKMESFLSKLKNGGWTCDDTKPSESSEESND